MLLQYENVKYKWIVIDTLGNVIKKRESGIPIFSANYGNSDDIL